jgi:anti-sigma factor RsiW
MTCAKVKKKLPLLAGGDLATRKERKLRAHIDLCPDCRRELEELRSAIARVKAAAREKSAGEWKDAEWKALMDRVTAQKADRGRSAPIEPRPRWALTSGLAAVALLAVLAFLFRDSIFKFRDRKSVV